jgi:hypothetical protein
MQEENKFMGMVISVHKQMYILFNSINDSKTELVTKAEIIYDSIIGLY